MKTGKHYFGLLTEEEQRNFRQACEEVGNIPFDALMESYNINFEDFISSSFHWRVTKQGVKYWTKIADSNRTEQPIEKPKTITKPLATFRLTLIYTVIVHGFLGLFMLVYHIGHQQGYKSGYRNGIEKVDSIVNYEELTTESVEAVQELQLNTMRDESK